MEHVAGTQFETLISGGDDEATVSGQDERVVGVGVRIHFLTGVEIEDHRLAPGLLEQGLASDAARDDGGEVVGRQAGRAGGVGVDEGGGHGKIQES